MSPARKHAKLMIKTYIIENNNKSDMQIKVQGTKPNTSLERKTKNLCSHIEMQLDFIRLVMRKLIQQITTRYM